MAINENVNLANVHRIYLGVSGGGKSHLMKHHLKPEKRQLIWDPNNDHNAHHFFSMRSWYANALRAVNSGAGSFRLALKIEPSPALFEQWCALVWTLLDGNRPLAIVAEEVAEVQKTAGKAPPKWGRLATQSRKYGGRIYCTTQYAQEIDKTIVRNCQHKYVGVQGDAEAAKYAARFVSKTPRDILELPQFSFLHGELGKQDTDTVRAPKPRK